MNGIPKKLVSLALIFLFLFPLYLLVVSSSGSTWAYPEFFPKWSFFTTLGTGQILRIIPHVFSSFLYSQGTVLLTISLTIYPAKYLAYSHSRYKLFLEGVLLLPSVLSPFTFLMGIQFISLKLGFGNSFFAVMLILSVVSYPYMLRALTAAYRRLDSHLLVCARNLGASPLEALLKVEFPLILPAVIAGGNIVFLTAFSNYFLVFIMGGSSVKSLALAIFPLLTSSSRQITSLLNLFFLFVPLVLFAIVDGMVLSYYRKRGL